MPFLSKKKLRRACVLAMREQDWLSRGIFMERSEGEAYAALFRGEYDWVLATIPNRYAKDLEVYLNYFDKRR